jgi:hypothetical protein
MATRRQCAAWVRRTGNELNWKTEAVTAHIAIPSVVNFCKFLSLNAHIGKFDMRTSRRVLILIAAFVGTCVAHDFALEGLARPRRRAALSIVSALDRGM